MRMYGHQLLTKWPLLMTPGGGTTCVLGFDMLPSSSSTLSYSLELATSSTTLIMGAKQLRSIVMLLSAREASSFIRITLTSHGGSLLQP
jgi:hypothetical protein